MRWPLRQASEVEVSEGELAGPEPSSEQEGCTHIEMKRNGSAGVRCAKREGG